MSRIRWFLLLAYRQQDALKKQLDELDSPEKLGDPPEEDTEESGFVNGVPNEPLFKTSGIGTSKEAAMIEEQRGYYDKYLGMECYRHFKHKLTYFMAMVYGVEIEDNSSVHVFMFLTYGF